MIALRALLFIFISSKCDGFILPACNLRPKGSMMMFLGVERRSNMLSMRRTARHLSKGWEPGDFEYDLRVLKTAVAKSNALTSLAETERIHLLETIANQKRELLPLMKKLLLVLLAAFSYSSAYLFYGPSSNLISRVLDIPVVFMNIFFAIFTVHIPVISFLIIRSTYRPKPRRKNEFEAEFIDLSEDCSNFSLCLLEAWMTTVWPSFFLIWLSVALQKISTDNLMNIFWRLGISFSQLITRLGTAAALHQFPILLYRLRYSRTYGPIQLLPFVVHQLVDATMNSLALGFVMDLTSVANILSQMRASPMKQTISWKLSMKSVTLTFLLVSSFISNFVHFIAFKKLLRIGMFTNLPLLSRISSADIDESIKLRYRLHWREPKRLFPSFKRIVRNLTNFIFSGWGENFAIKVENMRLPHILSLVDKECEMGVVPARNRHLWISTASEGVAKVHDENYHNQSFQDPLGIAIYQTFGVGMSMDFDHTSPVEEHEEPSIHRLRARAAKSAIKCYNDIPDVVARENGDISDPALKKSIIMKEIQRRRDKLKSDVCKLMVMLPSNAPAPEGKQLEILTMRRSDLKSVQLNESLPPGLQNEEDDDDRKNKSFIDPYLNDEIFEDTVFV